MSMNTSFFTTVPPTVLYRRHIKLKAKFESRSSYFSFKKRKLSRVNPGSTWGQHVGNLHCPTSVGEGMATSLQGLTLVHFSGLTYSLFVVRHG